MSLGRGAQTCLMTGAPWELVKNLDFWVLPWKVLTRWVWSRGSVTLRTSPVTHEKLLWEMISLDALRSAVASHRAQHTAVAQWMFAELPATETGPSKRGELFLDSLAVLKGPSSCLSEVQGPGGCLTCPPSSGMLTRDC